MRVLIPFLDELFDLRTQVIFGVKIHDAQALALKDAEPLFDLIHPRTMYWCEVYNKARMVGEPCSDFFTMVRTDIVAYEVNRVDVLVNLCIECFQKGDAFPLPLPLITVPIDLARAGVTGGKEMECARPLVLMLHAVGPVVELGGQGRGATRPRLQGSLLVHGEHQFIRMQRPGVEVNQLRHGVIKGGVPRLLGVEPHMLAPGLQVMRGQNPAHGGSRHVLHEAIRHELTRQFSAIPRGEAAAQRIWALAGEAYHVDRDFGGKNRPWPRGQGRLKDRPDAGQENAWPSGGPRSVARQRPAPPQLGRPRLPARGSSSPGGPRQRPG